MSQHGSPYNNQPPQGGNPYGAPLQQGYPYNSPPPQYPPQGQPYPPQGQPYPPQYPPQGYGAPAVPPKKKGSVLGGCLSTLLSFAIIGGLIFGARYIAFFTSEKAGAQSVDSNAAKIITEAQSAAYIGSIGVSEPEVKPKTVFTTGSLSLVARLDMEAIDFKAQPKYYMQVKYFVADSVFSSLTKIEYTSKVLTVEDDGKELSYFSVSGLDDGKYTAEVYWCAKASCDDRKIGRVVNFEVK